MTNRQAGEQSGFAIASRFALDCQADLAPAIRLAPTVDCVDESPLPRKQPHFLAGENALRDRQGLEKGYDTLGPGQVGIAPSRRATTWLCAGFNRLGFSPRVSSVESHFGIISFCGRSEEHTSELQSL